ncbi:CST complex subunit Ten1 [Xylaria arbuscula]|nr:CST complex subunit Ten1 [Xylaria arbuscula]
MSNGPLPSERTLLSALCNRQIGDKVRFLGCVTGYFTHSAQLTLRHQCPKEDGDVEALVDVNLLLKSLKSEQTDVGQWVHVIGYITFLDRVSSNRKTTARVGVQALVFWVAQDLDLSAYERSMLADAEQNAGNLTPKNPAAE